MIALIGYYWYALLAAFGIGLITAWWTWGQAPAARPVEIDPDDELIDWAPSGPTPPASPLALVDVDPVPAVPLPDEAVPVEPAPAEQHDLIEPTQESPVEPDAADHAEAEPAVSIEDELGQAIAASAADHYGEDSRAPDDLMVIKGIGPQLDALLRSLGVQRFADIAGWMPEDIERIDGQLGIFKGRIIRDEWIGQARLLAKGDMDAFSQRYGHLS
jgi:predicted flap endonuclease-1-like 5' DNA nuclease